MFLRLHNSFPSPSSPEQWTGILASSFIKALSNCLVLFYNLKYIILLLLLVIHVVRRRYSAAEAAEVVVDELTTSIYSNSYIHYNVLDTLGQPKLGVGVMTGEVTDQPTCLWCGLAVLCHFTGLLCEPGRHMYRYRHSLPTYLLSTTSSCSLQPSLECWGSRTESVEPQVLKLS